jgi:hypothetical protein
MLREEIIQGLYRGDSKAIKEAIKTLEQEPKLGKDGTLIVTTEHYENVNRVLVQHGINGTLFYQDKLREESVDK